MVNVKNMYFFIIHWTWSSNTTWECTDSRTSHWICFLSCSCIQDYKFQSSFLPKKDLFLCQNVFFFFTTFTLCNGLSLLMEIQSYFLAASLCTSSKVVSNWSPIIRLWSFLRVIFQDPSISRDQNRDTILDRVSYVDGITDKFIAVSIIPTSANSNTRKRLKDKSTQKITYFQ